MLISFESRRGEHFEWGSVLFWSHALSLISFFQMKSKSINQNETKMHKRGF